MKSYKLRSSETNTATYFWTSTLREIIKLSIITQFHLLDDWSLFSSHRSSINTSSSNFRCSCSWAIFIWSGSEVLDPIFPRQDIELSFVMSSSSSSLVITCLSLQSGQVKIHSSMLGILILSSNYSLSSLTSVWWFSKLLWALLEKGNLISSGKLNFSCWWKWKRTLLKIEDFVLPIELEERWSVQSLTCGPTWWLINLIWFNSVSI